MIVVDIEFLKRSENSNRNAISDCRFSNLYSNGLTSNLSSASNLSSTFSTNTAFTSPTQNHHHLHAVSRGLNSCSLVPPRPVFPIAKGRHRLSLNNLSEIYIKKNCPSSGPSASNNHIFFKNKFIAGLSPGALPPILPLTPPHSSDRGHSHPAAIRLDPSPVRRPYTGSVRRDYEGGRQGPVQVQAMQQELWTVEQSEGE